MQKLRIYHFLNFKLYIKCSNYFFRRKKLLPAPPPNLTNSFNIILYKCYLYKLDLHVQAKSYVGGILHNIFCWLCYRFYLPRSSKQITTLKGTKKERRLRNHVGTLDQFSFGMLLEGCADDHICIIPRLYSGQVQENQSRTQYKRTAFCLVRGPSRECFKKASPRVFIPTITLVYVR